MLKDLIENNRSYRRFDQGFEVTKETLKIKKTITVIASEVLAYHR